MTHCRINREPFGIIGVFIASQTTVNRLTQQSSKAVLCEGWKVTLAEGMKKTLKKDLLLTLGVSIETIVEATVETPYTRLTVSEVKG